MWVQNQQSKELIAEMESQSRNSGLAPLRAVRGGKSPGTYAHELLAVSYAGWINPKFQLMVNQAFLDYRAGKLQRQIEEQKALPSPLTPSHQREIQKAIASRVYMLPEPVRPAAFKRVYSKLKDRFDVGTYKDIDDSRYMEVLDAIESLALEGELLPRDQPAPIRPVKRLNYSEASLLATGMVDSDGRFKRWANCGPSADPLERLLTDLNNAAFDGESVIVEDMRGAIGMYNAMVSMIANDTELMIGLENHVSRIRESSRARLRTTL
tara:strand:+ start:805 stop:1605 length:801 start_codon:yes stop_codon:yes gene_type:complete